MKQNLAKENLAVAFPDEGACKRFGKKFKGYEIIICTKVRDGKKRIVTLKEGNPKGKHVIIIDDLVQSGGTLIGCKDILYAAKAKKVSAYVTHAIFPSNSWEKFTAKQDKGFDRFYITDSCPEMANTLRGKNPFHILSLAESIAETVLKY
eukprot:TRINITY_DN1954_c0_g1_i1.p1 TRINITY_DN1954_c0_g1~~TRINITY_DN1954_c0_g1_i1.p1  ORF type:complete len:150 (-),score=29.01 TRINITY_DN1954_c0_g1_i1:435-884(-)